MRDFVMTSDSVTVGHPDKLCDQISDAVIDAYLAAGSRRGVVAECALASGIVFLSVRAADEPPCDLASLARRVIAEAGFDDPSLRGNGGPTVILDLASGQTERDGRGLFLPAAQMTTAFGYACDQTADAMPLPIWLAHRLTQGMDAARRDGRLPLVSPDAQAQVAVTFRDRRPVAISALAFAFGTQGHADPAAFEHILRSEVITPAFTGAPLAPDAATRLVCMALPGIAGPVAHSGLTGRKTADDGYGGFARQSGAAFSGKDPSRIDRIAQYAARQMARAVVTAGLATECEVQLSYVMGDIAPASLEVDCFGTGTTPDQRISGKLQEVFDLRVGAIAERMGLWDLPTAHAGRFYRDLATYGHMARHDLHAPWEDMELATALTRA